MDAVAPGLRAEIDDRIPDPRRLGVENGIGARHAYRHRVDEDVAVVAAVEPHRPADCRHAERIAIAADAADDAGNQPAGLGVIGRAETQQVEAGDRPRPHREHVAQNV